MSALHKEIRAGHPDAINWARIYAHTTSWDSLNNYLFKIIFEETRNLSLWKYVKENLFISDKLFLTKNLLGSKKKWELECLKGHMLNLCKGFDNRENVTDLSNIKNKPDVYSYLFHVHTNRKRSVEGYSGKNQFIEAVFDDLRRYKTNSTLSDYLKLSPGRTLYELMIALELKQGILDIKECSTHKFIEKESPIPEFFIPALKEYYFDIHTYKGVHKLKNILQKLPKLGAKAFEGGELQYSGMIISTYYRFYVTSNYGLDYLSEHRGYWSELSDIQNYLSMDKYFYPKLNKYF